MRRNIINYGKKQGGKINCGECKKFFAEDKLIADPKNNRYLCEGCYEPRDEEPEREPDHEPEERERCRHCGEYEDDCECDKDDEDVDIEYDKEESPRALRGEARITRERPPKETNKKSLIW